MRRELDSLTSEKDFHDISGSRRSECETEESLHIIRIFDDHGDGRLMNGTIVAGDFEDTVIDQFLKKVIFITRDNRRTGDV